MQDKNNFVKNIDFTSESATISSGGTTSSALRINGMNLAAFSFDVVPSNSISIHGSNDGTNFQLIRSVPSGTAFTITTPTNSSWYAMGPVDTWGFEYIRFVAASAQTPGVVITCILGRA